MQQGELKEKTKKDIGYNSQAREGNYSWVSLESDK